MGTQYKDHEAWTTTGDAIHAHEALPWTWGDAMDCHGVASKLGDEDLKAYDLTYCIAI